MDVRLEPWSESALDLLRRINTPQMRQHVGGPEPEERLLARHRRYLTMPATGRGCMYAVLIGHEMVGSIAYHQRDWHGEQIFEVGWNVLPPYQGRGIASAAGTALITVVREFAQHADAPHALHAFPSVENAPSNALCHRLGFTLLGPCDVEYPAGSGSLMRSIDWRIDLVDPGRLPSRRPGPASHLAGQRWSATGPHPRSCSAADRARRASRG